MVQNELNGAIEMIRAGQKEAAIPILKAILKQDQKNDRAWLWLAAAVDKLDDKKWCLEMALKANPENEQAKVGLARLTQSLATPTLEDLGIPASRPAPIAASAPEAPVVATAPASVIEMKICPYCKDQVRKDASVCPHCNQKIDVGTQLQKAGCALMQLPFLIAGLLLSGICLYAIIASMFTNGKIPVW